MRRILLAVFFLLLVGAGPVLAQEPFERDLITTSTGNLAITFIGHGSLLLEFNGKVIYVDPFGKLTDYGKLPKADIIFLTHDHFDHLDPEALRAVRTEKTRLVLTESCAARVADGIVMKNGESRTVDGIKVRAVPAYNIVHLRDDGQPFHPKGAGNGYILNFVGTLVYIAGDTENIPEMQGLIDIDYAFLPMNLPYTMTPAMAVEAALSFRPKVVYPYHYGETDPAALVTLLQGSGIEVRVRRMR